jgi:hypothetical protein
MQLAQGVRALAKNSVDDRSALGARWDRLSQLTDQFVSGDAAGWVRFVRRESGLSRAAAEARL